MAASFNARYGDVFRRPEALLSTNVAMQKVPGLDGQKMSKSYGNDIWMFLSGKPLKKAVGKILTDSRPPEEPKDPAGMVLFEFLELFLDETELADWKTRVSTGGEGAPGYGHLKQRLIEGIEEHFRGARERREALLGDLGEVERTLSAGAERARERATAVRDRAIAACGLR